LAGQAIGDTALAAPDLYSLGSCFRIDKPLQRLEQIQG